MSGWTDEQKRERMARDAAKIRDIDSWPMWNLHMKTQPWVTEREGMRFGLITPHDLKTVVLKDEGDVTEEFSSIEELVKVWSVD